MQVTDAMVSEMKSKHQRRKRIPRQPQHDQHVKFYRNHWKRIVAIERWKRNRANFIGLNPW